MNISFSATAKKRLCNIPVKTLCCRRALLCGLILYRLPQSNPDVLNLTIKLNDEFAEDDMFFSTPDEAFQCESCSRHFIRGVFLACGSVSDPQKYGSRYQLEFTVPDSDSRYYIGELLRNSGFSPLETVRSNRGVLYFRDNDAISDILNFVGASSSSFDFINEKIKRSYENDANRAANCDMANIQRAVNAANEQVSAINELMQSGKFSLLPSVLAETARIRLENPEISLVELAALHDPPITKSGVRHRLKKIIEICEESKK